MATVLFAGHSGHHNIIWLNRQHEPVEDEELLCLERQGKKGLRLQQGGSFGPYRDDVGSYGLQIVVHEVLGFWVEGLAFGLHSWVRGFKGPLCCHRDSRDTCISESSVEGLLRGKVGEICRNREAIMLGPD